MCQYTNSFRQLFRIPPNIIIYTFLYLSYLFIILAYISWHKLFWYRTQVLWFLFTLFISFLASTPPTPNKDFVFVKIDKISNVCSLLFEWHWCIYYVCIGVMVNSTNVKWCLLKFWCKVFYSWLVLILAFAVLLLLRGCQVVCSKKLS